MFLRNEENFEMNCSRLYHIATYLDGLRFSAILGIIRVQLKDCGEVKVDGVSLFRGYSVSISALRICEGFYVRVLQSFKLKEEKATRQQIWRWEE